jgi:glyoxylase-like metal-dependent hydrolase (beta-lactamase superfamily II)
VTRYPGILAALVAILTAVSAEAQELRTIIVDPEQGIHYADAEDRTVRALPVRDNVYVIVGAGANITVQTGENGVLLVDTGSGEETGKVLSLLAQLSPWPVGYILNTSFLPDHTGGNAEIASVAEAAGGARGRGSRGNSSPIAAHEAVLGRLSAPTGQEAPTPSEAWPSQTYYTRYHDIYFNGEGIQMFHESNAVTDGDSIVYFRRSDVIAAGDIFLTTRYPTIDAASGGSIDGIIDGLNHLLELTIPEEKQEGGTIVVPGHGRISDEADVVEYRDMLTIIRDRFRAAIEDGMTLDQVRAAGLTRDYDGRYGSEAGEWTTDMFVDAVYESLAREP